MGWTPPTASMCHNGGVENHLGETTVGQASTIILDLAKNVFHAHGADASDNVLIP